MNFQPGLIVHDMRKLVTSDEKKVITLFLEFKKALKSVFIPQRLFM